MSEIDIRYPLDTGVLEEVPHNIRRTQIVRLARGLAQQDQAELISQLCNSGKSSSAARSTTAQKRNDLTSLLDSDTQNADPTTTYHLQELGLLAAAGTAQKQHILDLAESKNNKLIANKALLLAIHSRCVSNEDILQLFQNASERKKQLIVRTCAREPLRQNLTDSFVTSWLNDTPDRRVIACELLHELSAGEPTFASELKKILVRDRIAKVSKSNNVDALNKHKVDEACFKALRIELVWKSHASDILNAITTDLQATKSLIGKASVFDLWYPLLNTSAWKLPGSKTASTSKLATLAAYVPWKDILYLYSDNLPFVPESSAVHEVWVNQRFEGIVSDRVNEKLLADMSTLTEWAEDWSPHLKLVIPFWLTSTPMVRAVSSYDWIKIIQTKLSWEDGRVKQQYQQLAGTFLKTINSSIKDVSREFFDTFTSQFNRVLTQVTPASFYTGVLDETQYASRADYLRADEIKKTCSLFDSFALKLLENSKITTGHQLQVFNIVHEHSKRLRLRAEDFRSPLQLVTTTQISNFLSKYQNILQDMVKIILQSISQRIRHAAERGRNAEQLETVFSRVVALGLVEVQRDVENMYKALAIAYPVVFGIPPVINVANSIAPNLIRFSRGRQFDSEPDVASKLTSDLIVNVVLPAAREDTFGDDAYFRVRPSGNLSRYRAAAQDIATRAMALEAIELIRRKWFDAIKHLHQPIVNSVISTTAIEAILSYLEDWVESAADSCRKAQEAKKANRHSTIGKSAHPENVQNAEGSLTKIGEFAIQFMEVRLQIYRQEEWKDRTQAANTRLIHRAFRLWASTAYYAEGTNPLVKEGPTRIDPYTLEPLLRHACRFPDEVRSPFQWLINRIFALRLNGKIQISKNGDVVDAPTNNYKKTGQSNAHPWNDASKLFQSIFDNASTVNASHEMLVYLENLAKDERPTSGFLKELEMFYDVRNPVYRKRLEQDFTRPIFADRLQCMQTLMKATERCQDSGEIIKTLNKISKAIENETLENRLAVITQILTSRAGSIVSLAMPSPSGNGSYADRTYVQFLSSPPKEEEWLSIIEASSALPKVMYKFLDDLLDSTDEKSDRDLRHFRTLSDEIFRRCLTWPCSTAPNADPRIVKTQSAWFDCAMELQWKLTLFRSGKVQAANTFRPMISITTMTRVRNFILELGFQCDKPFPKGKEETRAHEAEARKRRTEAALVVAHLFEDGYRARIGDGPARATPLSRKPAMEKKRMLDLLNMVQGEWVHCKSFVERVEDVIEQVVMPETTRSHQTQVLDLARALAEASITWAVKCRDMRPQWADKIKEVEAIVREQRRGGGRKMTTFRKRGRGGANTTPVDATEEDAPWCASKYFRFLPPVIARYWELSVQTFGIHHPAGQSTGRCILRMYLRWNFDKADQSPTRSQRQSIRCATALHLLSFCESAVHLKVVQSVLKDFRQDLLEKHVFSKPKDSPLLGKFSFVSPNEDDDEHDDDDDDDDENNATSKSLIQPFRLGGFYGYEKLTSKQGKRFAEFLVADVENPDLSIVDRVRASSKLRFLPAVSYMDFASILTTHFANRTAYAEAVREKKRTGAEITVSPPLASGVVETLFRSILADSNPMALFSLLDANLIRESSAKTTVLVAQRLVLLLHPLKVTEIIGVLFSRRGKDGLLIGPVKAFLRILFNFASQNESVIGSAVITKAVSILDAQWSRAELHVDARTLMVHSVIKALSQPVSEVFELFAWEVLQDLSSNANYSDLLRAVLICAEPVASVILKRDLSSIGETKEFRSLATEATRLGNATIRNKSKYLAILLAAMDTCLARHRNALAQFEIETDKRARGNWKKQANQAADVRALILVNLATWVDQSHDSYITVFNALRAVLTELNDEKQTEDNKSRISVFSNIVPAALTQLASACSKSNNSWAIYQDVSVVERMIEVLRPLVEGIVSGVPLKAFSQRQVYVNALAAMSSNLDKEGRKHSLYRQAFVAPFRESLSLLKREVELAASIRTFLPAVIDDDGADDQ